MNIYDVSEKAGVSIATVSRVINGNPNVSEKTRAKINAVMEEMGYTPNVFARGLGLGSIKTIGILCSDSADNYLAKAISYLERDFRANGYDVILCCTGKKLETKQKYLDLLASKKVDALVLVGSHFIESKKKDNDYIKEASKKFPIMMVNGYLDYPNVYCTLCDDKSATFDATSKLIESGCKKILYLYTSASYSGFLKRQGYLDAVEHYGLELGNQYVHLCEKGILEARELLISLHQSGLEFDAVVTSDDFLAVGSVKFAYKMGLKVPEDLCVIGYNDSGYAISIEPEISSIDNKVEAICVATVNTLMGVFHGQNMPRKTTIACDLVKRGTTKF